MRRYTIIAELVNKNKIKLNEEITLEKLEKLIGIKRLPKSYYNNNDYWNKNNSGIGSILNELGVRAKLKKSTVIFEKKD